MDFTGYSFCIEALGEVRSHYLWSTGSGARGSVVDFFTCEGTRHGLVFDSVYKKKFSSQSAVISIKSNYDCCGYCDHLGIIGIKVHFISSFEDDKFHCLIS